MLRIIGCAGPMGVSMVIDPEIFVSGVLIGSPPSGNPCAVGDLPNRQASKSVLSRDDPRSECRIGQKSRAHANWQWGTSALPKASTVLFPRASLSGGYALSAQSRGADSSLQSGDQGESDRPLLCQKGMYTQAKVP